MNFLISLLLFFQLSTSYYHLNGTDPTVVNLLGYDPTSLVYYPSIYIQLSVKTATISLSWTGPTTLEGGAAFPAGATVVYNVYRGFKSDCSDCTRVNTTPIAGVSYTDTNIPTGKVYYYGVTAYLTPPGNLASKMSNIAAADLTATVIPSAAPSGLKYIIIIP